jgi:hypothetical protein
MAIRSKRGFCNANRSCDTASRYPPKSSLRMICLSQLMVVVVDGTRVGVRGHDHVKVGVLTGSVAAALLAGAVLTARSRTHRRRQEARH